MRKIRKSCKKKRCPYYQEKICPFRHGCENSNDRTWVEERGDKE